MNRIAALLILCALPACGGGGATPPAPVATALAIATPSASPTTSAKPSAAPSATPIASAAPTATASSAPTASPSPTPVPLALHVMGGAPLSATASQLANNRRTAKAQGVTNGLPVLVESSGMVALYGGTQTSWVSNIANATDIPETGLTVTPSGNLSLNNPGPTPLSCLGSISAVCIVHPTAWEWGTSSANGKPVGAQTLTVAYADGTMAQTFDFVYDGWALPCNAGWAYIGGVPVAQATRATSDVYADCVAGNIVFTQGAVQIGTPQQDQYGRYETVFPTVTAAFIQNSLFANAPMASISQGEVFGIITHDGGFAKVYFTSGAGVAVTAATGMSLHSKPDGSYAF